MFPRSPAQDISTDPRPVNEFYADGFTNPTVLLPAVRLGLGFASSGAAMLYWQPALAASFARCKPVPIPAPDQSAAFGVKQHIPERSSLDKSLQVHQMWFGVSRTQALLCCLNSQQGHMFSREAILWGSFPFIRGMNAVGRLQDLLG